MDGLHGFPGPVIPGRLKHSPAWIKRRDVHAGRLYIGVRAGIPTSPPVAMHSLTYVQECFKLFSMTILTYSSPLNSLLKIKKIAHFGRFSDYLFVFLMKP
jgi:hypothetical protein